MYEHSILCQINAKHYIICLILCQSVIFRTRKQKSRICQFAFFDKIGLNMPLYKFLRIIYNTFFFCYSNFVLSNFQTHIRRNKFTVFLKMRGAYMWLKIVMQNSIGLFGWNHSIVRLLFFFISSSRLSKKLYSFHGEFLTLLIYFSLNYLLQTSNMSYILQKALKPHIYYSLQYFLHQTGLSLVRGLPHILPH